MAWFLLSFLSSPFWVYRYILETYSNILEGFLALKKKINFFAFFCFLPLLGFEQSSKIY